MNQNGRQDYQRNNDHARRMTEIALRGTALLWDIQADTARRLFEIQANNAMLFGVPDFTQMFRVRNGGNKGVFSTTIDQALNSMRQINDTVTEVQLQLSRVAEQQTAGIAERFEQSIEEVARRSQQGLEEIRRLAEEQADEAEQTAYEARSRADERQQGGQTEERQAQAAGQQGAQRGTEPQGGAGQREGTARQSQPNGEEEARNAAQRQKTQPRATA